MLDFAAEKTKSRPIGYLFDVPLALLLLHYAREPNIFLFARETKTPANHRLSSVIDEPTQKVGLR